jgi:hypothetical protein
MPFSVARVGSPELGDGGHAPSPRARPPGRLRTPCREWERTPNTLWSGEQGGPVAWQPPHRQDEDLVPLTAGACSPRRMSSRRIPRQTSGRIPALMTAEAQPRGDTARRPNLTRHHCRTANPLVRWVKQRSAADASVPSRFGPPPGHALKSRPGRRPAYRPFERLDHCHRRSGQRPIRPALSDRLVGPGQSEGRAASAAQRLATLHQRSLTWRESPRAAVVGGLWPRGAGYSAAARQPAGLM